jgi:hypothetical protein
MQYSSLDGPQQRRLLDALAEMPRWLAAACADLTPEQSLTPGPAGAFSPVEQAWHLAELEREGFALRIRRLRIEDNPALPDFDGAAAARERDYRGRSLDEGLHAFAAARAETLALIGSIAPGEWGRTGNQEGVGPVSLCDMPVFLHQHDQSHVAEMRAWARHAGLDIPAPPA